MSATNNHPSIVRIISNGRCQPNPGPGSYAAVLSITRNGKPVEHTITGTVADGNHQRVQLLAVAEGLEALRSPCTVELISYSQYVVRGMTEWIGTWLENGWLTSKKQPVKNADLWQRIQAACQKHRVRFSWRQWNGENAEDRHLHSLVAEAGEGQRAEEVETASKPEGEAPVETTVAEKPYRLMVSGSRRASASMLEYARRVVARAIEYNWQIVVGDNAQGVDKAVVKECNLRKYANVVVVGIAGQPRNGGVGQSRYVQIGTSYSERDRLMAKGSDRGLFIWDGRSPGTKQGYRFIQSLGKTAHLMDFSGTFVK